MKRILCVAGGTGGHIFPAIAFGKWIGEMEKGTSVDYMCGSRKIEKEMYGSEEIIPFVINLEGSPLGTKVIGKKLIRTWFLFSEFFKVFRYMFRKKPDYCILFGGYISLLPLLSAFIMRVPVVVHEQNTIAGKVTKLSKRLGYRVITGWEECLPFQESSFLPVGIPVRSLRTLQEREAWNILHIGFDKKRGPTIVVMAGSLGSVDVIRTVMKLAIKEQYLHWVFLILDERTRYVENVPENVHFIGKKWNMEAVYSLADAAIVRAGASTLAELAVYRIPGLVIPWLRSTGSHQMKNAEHFLRKSRGSIWVEGKDSLDDLCCKLEKLVNNDRYPADYKAYNELLHNRASENIRKCMTAL